MNLSRTKLKEAIKSIAWPHNQHLCILNENGKVIMANQRMQKDLKLENPRQANINFFDLLEPVQIENFKKAFRYALINQIPYSLELMFKSQGHTMRGQLCSVDGNANEEQFYLWSSTCVGKQFGIKSKSNGKSDGEIDLSKKLKEAEERLKYIHLLTNDAIWERDLNTEVIIRNDKLNKLIGNEHTIDKGLFWWLSRVHPDDRQVLSDILKQAIDQQLPSWKSEYRFLCFDGEYKNILDHGQIIYENNVPVKMIGSLRDVTDEKLLLTILMEEKLHQQKVLSENTLRVQEQERSRFGRELHDNVNQIISAARLYVRMINPVEKEIEIRDKVVEYCSLAIEEIRRLSREMVTPDLDDEMLVENMERIISDVQVTTPIKVKFTQNIKKSTLSPGKKLALYRILQEQIKNIIKYSKATEVNIQIKSLPNTLKMTIADNGVGFDTEIKKSGIGLSSMQERVKYYNGTIRIDSAIGAGTKITAEIPLEAA